MKRYRKYIKEELEIIVKDCSSISQVLVKVGVKPVGNSITGMSKRLKEYKIDTSHFSGQGHNKGKMSPRRKSADEVLKLKSGRTKEKAAVLRRALTELGEKEICKICSIESWQGAFLRLEIDHINGNPLDDRKENLRYLCPNCHSQTKTYGVKNIKNKGT